MKIACVQMETLPNRADENFSRAVALVCEASKNQPDVILLPETWNTGFAPDRLDPTQADDDGARTKSTFSALAAELGVNIVAGSVTNRKAGGVYNTAYVFDRAGRCVCSYDKTHLFTPMDEDKTYQKGNSLARFTLDGVSCALIICYDLRFPELIRMLALPGLDVLFVVSQWPETRISHLEVLSQARAIENQMFVALCNSCGTAYETKFGRHSAVIDPWGAVLAQADDRQSIVFAEADWKILRQIRSTIPVFRDRRPELYRQNDGKTFNFK